MLNLLGKVSFDASGFTQAMSKMKATAGPAGKLIGDQIRGKMLEAFGAGAALALFKKQLQSAVEIKSGATKFGTSTTTFQTLATVANQAGTSVEELVKILDDGGPASDQLRSALESAQEELQKTGQIIESDTVEKLAKTNERLASVFGRVTPIITNAMAFLFDVVESAYKLFVALPIAAGAKVAGDLFGNKRLSEAGRMMAKDALTPIGGDSKSAVSDAAVTAAAFAMDRADERQSAKRSVADKTPQVSSLVAAGAIFNRSLGPDNPQQKTLDTMRSEITRIRSIIEKGGI